MLPSAQARAGAAPALVNRTTPDAAPVLARANAGYLSTLFSQGVRVVCKLAGLVVLARLVSPADHGVFAMAASFTLLLSLLRDGGTGIAAIQAPRLSEGQQTALLQLHVLLGFALAGVTWLLAPSVAHFYRSPELTPLLHLMSASFVLNGLNAWPRNLLGRELRFGELNRLETIAAAAGTFAMIVAAWLGVGAAAFAWFLLVSEAVMGLLAWTWCHWRPRAPAAWREIVPLLRTGLQLTAGNLLAQLLAIADTLGFGRWLGAGALGPYNRAGQLLQQPVQLVAVPFGQVLLATLSRLGTTSPAFAPHLRDTANAIAHLTLPVVAVCVALPDFIVRLVLGAAWPDAAPLLRWLALGAAATLLTATVQPLCIATGRAHRLTGLSALALAATATALWVARDCGPSGLAGAVALANVALLAPRLWWATRDTPVSLHDYAGAFTGPLTQTLALAAGLTAGRWAVSEVTGHTLLAVVGALSGGAAAYALALAARRATRAELARMRALLPGLRATPSPAEP